MLVEPNFSRLIIAFSELITNLALKMEMIHYDPFDFDDSDDFHIESYQPCKKLKKESLSLRVASSIVSDLVDNAIDVSKEYEIELNSIFERVIQKYSESPETDPISKGTDIEESVTDSEETAMRDVGDKDVEDIFLNVMHKYGGLNEPASILKSDKMVQCLDCYTTSFDLSKMWNISHICLTNNVMICDQCKIEIANSSQLIAHMKKNHIDEPIVFVTCKSDKQPLINPSVLCSKDCPTFLCFKVSAEEVELNKIKLSNLRISELHKFLLARLKIQNEFGFDTSDSLRLGKHNYCKNALSRLFGLSQYMIRTVFSEHAAGFARFQHGNVGNFYSTPKKDNAIAFILHFAQCHSENLPDRTCLRLPSYLTVKFIYEHYCEKVAKENQIGCREFYLVFNKVFAQSKRLYDWLPRITFQSPSSHPVCNECCLINDLRRKSKTESEAHYAEGRKRNHMLYIRRKYLLYCYRSELTVRYPQDYLSLAIDDMDQKKIWSPFTRINTKDTSGILRLNNHLIGCILTNGNFPGDKVYKIFLNSDQFAQDSNKTVSQIQDALEFSQERLGKLPRKLLVQTDNCSRDLKNQFVLSYFYLLVERGVFDEILVSHMPIGHTHNDVDHMFGVLAGHLKKLEIPTFEALKSEIGKIKLDDSFPIVKELVHTTDFSSFITPYLLQISGHTAFFQFRIRKENKLTQLSVKEDELDADWMYPRGIKLLSMNPESMNLSVSPFRTETDYSEIFISVVRKYIPSLEHKFGEEEVEMIRKDWEKRIQLLINLKESDYLPFNINILKKQTALNEAERADPLPRQSRQGRTAAITATFYPQEISSFSVEDLKEDVSLVFYCATKRFRPWIGLFLELIDKEGPPKVKVEWLKKDKKSYVLDSKPDGSQYISLLELESVMFSDVLSNTNVAGNRCGPYMLENDVKKQILEAYIERDLNLS